MTTETVFAKSDATGSDEQEIRVAARNRKRPCSQSAPF
ncbi:hypothetical protein ALQ65_200313 [Pseudomonas syringae pv. coriandricola]|uniref:Uncharacterized protein n=1 Tax=Pseudomonas syringae pv. coriandricola TaxID=264453 RepID=A0A3M3J937_9PSED|nr:hypothetical protein ALQ65_200313 [Pseudomonas syringae pv. coriandricola]